MSKRRIVMMISVLFITILVASGFYVLTGEVDSGGIHVISSTTKSGDWEKVYEAGAPYGSKNNSYYIRYTGEESNRTTVDLDEERNGLTIKNGYPYIFNQKITSTYKMFSNNDTLYRVLISSSIAFADTDTNLTTAKYKGIQENTFDGDSQVIDCIYRTPNLDIIDARGSGLTADYDKTQTTYDNAVNVTTYVSLDSNNISRNDITPTEWGTPYSYIGKIKNVYVDKSIGNTISYLFCKTVGGESVDNVLIDVEGSWTDLVYLFAHQTFGSLPNHFRFNNSAENLNCAFTFSSITEISFELPSKVNSISNMFAQSKIAKISDNFKIPNSVTNMRGMFWECNNLESFPKEFAIPDKVTDCYGIFYHCYKLSGTIVLNKNVTRLLDMFEGAGRDSQLNIENTNCPIVMKYSDSNIPSLALRQNIYGLASKGKVYKQLYDWEVIEDNDGPYTDSLSGIKYYLHYRGKEKDAIVDLGIAKGKLTVSGATNVDSGVTKIFGTEVTSTYRMFAKTTEYNENNESVYTNDRLLYRVIIPSSIAFNDNEGIKPNTFDGDSQVIDCIYRTPNLGDAINARGTGLTSAFDKTGITYTNASNVSTYVSLDTNNISRTNASSSNSYNGVIQNVYVDKSVNTITYLFDTTSGGNVIKKLLIDENGLWTDLSYLCNGQTFELLPSHFKFNSKVKNLSRCFNKSGLVEISDSFVIPNEVDNVFDMFAYCDNLTKVSDNFVLPSSGNLRNVQGIFYFCENIKYFPENFVIPEKVNNCSQMFAHNEYLSTVVTFPSTADSLTSCLDGAGVQSKSTIGDTNCPIVMKYSDTNIPSLAYRTNVKGLVDNGKVYKKLYDWEVVQDDNGLYTDSYSSMKYYIHYRGSKTTVDLGVEDSSNKLTVSGTSGVNSGTTKIFGIEVTNTYKMFAHNSDGTNDSNDKLYRVFIPSSIAFNTNGGIKENTFDGDSQVIDCIYRTPKLSTIDERGTGLISTYDKTGISYTNASNVTTYVSLDSNNMSRNDITPTEWGTTYSYIGKIKNVYVDKSMGNTISCLFAKTVDRESVNINNVLIDENGIWTNLSYIFSYQTFTVLPDHFKFNNLAENLQYTFGYSSIAKISFELPSHVNNLHNMFDHSKITKISDNFKIPNSVTNIVGMFWECNNLESLPKEFVIPDKVTDCYGAFYHCYKLSGTISIPKSVTRVDDIFTSAGTQATTKITASDGKQYPIITKVVTGSTADTVLTRLKYSTVYIERLATLSSENQSQPVVIDDNVDSVVNDTDSIQDSTDVNDSTTDNSADSSEKIVIEDETEWVAVTVNKKNVDEIVDETQENSQSSESVEENKSDEDEVQE